MERHFQVDHWGSLVRDWKDSEREQHGIPNYTTEQLARKVLSYVQTTRFRQYALFTQQRGEEYDAMIASLEAAGFDRDALHRLLAEEEYWTSTLGLAK
jgi:excinuclease UvrABC ATPase subunit